MNKYKDINKIITLCGSTKFKEAFELCAKKLNLEGNVVMSVNFFGHADGIELSQKQKIMLDEIHKQKISMSDAIYVINQGGYIGESTLSEIIFAYNNNKEIYFMEYGFLNPTIFTKRLEVHDGQQ